MSLFEKKENVDIKEMIALEEELQQLKREQGIETEEGKVSKFISKHLEKSANRQKVEVDRKRYLCLAIFTGWMGGHRFYAKRYKLGILYLAFFWTGIPFAMTLVDLIEAIPIPVDEKGMITI